MPHLDVFSRIALRAPGCLNHFNHFNVISKQSYRSFSRKPKGASLAAGIDIHGHPTNTAKTTEQGKEYFKKSVQDTFPGPKAIDSLFTLNAVADGRVRWINGRPICSASLDRPEKPQSIAENDRECSMETSTMDAHSLIGACDATTKPESTGRDARPHSLDVDDALLRMPHLKPEAKSKSVIKLTVSSGTPHTTAPTKVIIIKYIEYK